jgi:hypothetical protein
MPSFRFGKLWTKRELIKPKCAKLPFFKRNFSQIKSGFDVSIDENRRFLCMDKFSMDLRSANFCDRGGKNFAEYIEKRRFFCYNIS